MGSECICIRAGGVRKQATKHVDQEACLDAEASIYCDGADLNRLGTGRLPDAGHGGMSWVPVAAACFRTLLKACRALPHPVPRAVIIRLSSCDSGRSRPRCETWDVRARGLDREEVWTGWVHLACRARFRLTTTIPSRLLGCGSEIVTYYC